jgi:hypothetical protein
LVSVFFGHFPRQLVDADIPRIAATRSSLKTPKQHSHLLPENQSSHAHVMIFRRDISHQRRVFASPGSMLQMKTKIEKNEVYPEVRKEI